MRAARPRCAAPFGPIEPACCEDIAWTDFLAWDQAIASDSFDEVAQVLDLANVIVHGSDGTIVHWTTGCERFYGWSRHEAVGAKVDDLLATRFPQPRETILAALRREGSWQGELEQTGKDGSAISIASLWEARAAGDGTTLSILQTNHDITELKRAQSELAGREAHLRSILDIMPRR